MRDLDWALPTRATPIRRRGACSGAGTPQEHRCGFGVLKALFLIVGEAPSTELFDADGDNCVRRRTNTCDDRRPRSCVGSMRGGILLLGSTDSPLGRTNLDILDTFEKINICTGYEIEAKSSPIADTMDKIKPSDLRGRGGRMSRPHKPALGRDLPRGAPSVRESSGRADRGTVSFISPSGGTRQIHNMEQTRGDSPMGPSFTMSRTSLRSHGVRFVSDAFSVVGTHQG
jgi:hypothetical protein